MQHRYHVESRDHTCFMEVPYTDNDKLALVGMRYRDNRFKGKHIKAVIQAHPDVTPTYRVVYRNVILPLVAKFWT